MKTTKKLKRLPKKLSEFQGQDIYLTTERDRYSTHKTYHFENGTIIDYKMKLNYQTKKVRNDTIQSRQFAPFVYGGI